MPDSKYVIILEPGPTNWSAFSPNVPGCAATGQSAQETLAEFLDALDFHLEGLREEGEPLPPEYTEYAAPVDSDGEYVRFPWAPVNGVPKESRINPPDLEPVNARDKSSGRHPHSRG